MHIGLIGGLERGTVPLAKLAADAGHALEVHDGRMRGRGVGTLRRVVQRSDFVIILTGINSHQAVWIAKQTVRESHKPGIVLRRCGPDAFRDLLGRLEEPRPDNQSEA